MSDSNIVGDENQRQGTKIKRGSVEDTLRRALWRGYVPFGG